MSAERIDEIIGRHRGSSYGLAIRLQQQFGMSWREATSLAGYDDSPRSTHLKPEPPPYIPTSEELAERERMVKEYRECLRQHNERLKKDHVERINELMELAEVRKQLLVIRDDLWYGMGVVDEEPTLIDDKIAGGHIGVLMLRAPYANRLTDTVTHKKVMDRSWQVGDKPEKVVTTIKDYEDFASVRVGIYLPHLGSEPSYDTKSDEERIAIRILESNLELSGTFFTDGRALHTYAPIDLWPTEVPWTRTGLRPRRSERLLSERRDGFRTIGAENVLADTLCDLLVDAIRNNPLDILGLTKPLPPLPKQAWYKRLFS